MAQKEFVKNRKGLDIVKCCASCQHKAIDGDIRMCMNGSGIVSKDYLCPAWQMSENLINAGSEEGGRTKRPEYIQWLLERREEERKKCQPPAPIGKLIEEYEEAYDSRYL